MKSLFPPALACVLLAGACTGMTEPAATTVTVSAVFPAPDAGGVGRGDTVRLWMDMPMDSAGCATRFSLHVGDSTGAEVPGRVVFGNAYRQMMFVPDTPLLPGTRYFAHARNGMIMRGGMHDDGRGGMMGGGGMMTMSGGLPPGAVRLSDGMGWAFTTGL